MSCPRYVVEIKLYGTDCRYTWKMKTRVGDHKGFQKEMEVLAERGEFERISEGFVKHNGGLAKIEREWNRSYAELVGHDHHDVSAEEHPPECPWYKDWHSCNCGLFDNKENEE